MYVSEKVRGQRLGRALLFELIARARTYPGLERTLDPETRSPGQGFFLGIGGAQAFIDGEAEDVSGIRVINPFTVEISLDEPNASFLHLMAINFSYVVPQEEVEASGEDFGRNPVGTGAFQLQE